METWGQMSRTHIQVHHRQPDLLGEHPVQWEILSETNQTGDSWRRILGVWTRSTNTHLPMNTAQSRTKPNSPPHPTDTQSITGDKEKKGPDVMRTDGQGSQEAEAGLWPQCSAEKEWGWSPPLVKSRQHFVKWNIRKLGNLCKQTVRMDLSKSLNTGGNLI